jgi:threonine/homoserine/homoserine lactone efflux protein
MSFLEGLLTGLAMIIFIGPVLFTLLQAALSYGYRGGLAVALGIIISDVIAIVICKMGASAFLLEEGNRMWIAILGAAILIGMALRYLFRPQYFEEGAIKLGALNLSGLFSKGFLVNFINPFVFVVWIGIIGYGEAKFKEQLWIYLIAALIGIFLTDNLKAYYAAKLKRFLSQKRLNTVYKVTGALFIVFAFRLLYHAYELA